MAPSARDYQPAELCIMTDDQLLQTCLRLESRHKMMSTLLTELENEKSKLQRHQSMLSERIVRVESGVAPLENDDEQQVPRARESLAAAPMAGPCPSPMTTNGFAQPQEDANPQLRQPEQGADPQLSQPEDLLLRQNSDGSVRLTWFFDEQLLELLGLPESPLQRLFFEVRQLSEGANGCVRTRIHHCEIRVQYVDGEVMEQQIDVDIVAGKSYAFNVRACAEISGRQDLAYSSYSDTVTLGESSAIFDSVQEVSGAATDSLAPLPAGQNGQDLPPRSLTEQQVPSEAVQKSVEDEVRRRVQEERDRLQAQAEAQRLRDEAWRVAELDRLKEEAAKEARESAKLAAQLAQEAQHRAQLQLQERQRKQREEEERLLAAAQRQMEEELHRRVQEERQALAKEVQEAEQARSLLAEERRRVAEEEQRLRQDEQEIRSRLEEEEEGRRRQLLAKEEELQRWRMEEEEELRRRLRLQQEEDEARRLRLQSEEEEILKRRKQEEEDRQRWLQVQEEEWRRKVAAEEEERRRRLAQEEEERRLRLQAEEEAWRMRMAAEEEERQRRRAQEELEQEERRKSLEEARQHADAETEKVQRRMLEIQQEKERAEQEQQHRRKVEEEKLQQAVSDLRRREESLKQKEADEEERRARLAEEAQRRAKEEEAARQRLQELRLREVGNTESIAIDHKESEEKAKEALQPSEEKSCVTSTAQAQEDIDPQEEELQRIVEAKVRARLDLEFRKRAEEVENRIKAEEERQRAEAEEVELADEPEPQRQLQPQAILPQTEEFRTGAEIKDSTAGLGDAPGASTLAGKANNSKTPAGNFMDAFNKYYEGKTASTGVTSRTATSTLTYPHANTAANNQATQAQHQPLEEPELAQPNLSLPPPQLRQQQPQHQQQHEVQQQQQKQAELEEREMQQQHTLQQLQRLQAPASALTSVADSVCTTTVSSPSHQVAAQKQAAPPASFPRKQSYSGTGSPNMVRSPLPGNRSSLGQADYHSEAVSGSAENSGNPMDKWMSKILAEKGLPALAVEDQKPLSSFRDPAPTFPLRNSAATSISSPRPVAASWGTSGASLQANITRPAVTAPNARRASQSPIRRVAPELHAAQHQAPAAAIAAADGLSTVTQLPQRLVTAKAVPAAAAAPAGGGDCLGPTVTQLPNRSSGAAAPVSRTMTGFQHGADAARCYSGSLRGPISDATRAPVDMRVGGEVRCVTRAIAEAHRPGQTVGSSPDGSVVFNMGQIGRTHGLAAPLHGGPGSGAASGAVSPTGPGGMTLGVPRTGSFSGYPQAQRPAKPAVAVPLRQTSSAAACRPQAQQSAAGGRCGSMPQAGTTNLEISQRMARANELQRRLASSPQAAGPASPSPVISLNTPSLLNWAKEAAEQGQFREGDPMGMGLGLDTLHNLPPPPRSAPAVDVMAAGRSGRAGDARDPRCGGSRGSGGGSGGGGGSRHALTVLTSENRWETLTFLSNGNLEQQASDFLAQKGLKAAFISGLLSKMKSMVKTGQAQSSVDIVDLI
eukprot:TRINITY_DN29502_c0_g1_i2.p1 TRINITY_DN29502_c0_g1~~TRINITY_DN29502_c0_g1_i2.p1  ORF type:complete len:1555 (+),score=430.34 TRINITY_DN29502_c0_g1_i2:130-4665(+)